MVSCENLWQQALAILATQLTKPAFDTWIKASVLISLGDGVATIQVENGFVLNHLQKSYGPLLMEVLTDLTGQEITVKLITDGLEPHSLIGQESSLPMETTPKNATALNGKYTFSRFVVGPTNRMAHAASLAVAESPGREFNPLFLCGGVGLGKTHLMQAIAHYRLEMYPNAKVYYVSTERFTNDLITAIRQDNMEDFRSYYRSADFLLIDDIQFIKGKEYTQEEFFHTFNSLHEAGKQVVVASDRAPQRIPGLQDRLISRFSMGLIADIQVPDLETRMAILQKKAEYDRIRLPKEVIEYIASHYTSNIRELEGALIRAIAYTSLSNVAMTVENIAPVLNPPVEKVAAAPETIITIVAQHYQLKVEELLSNSRRREVSLARQVGMYLMRQHTDLSLPRIGEAFGGKDHTTVMYSCDKITQLQQKDWETSQTLTSLSHRINIAGQAPES
ncbi:chromosomal replication initiator protein; DnaA [Synechocystis sp. PCC 6803]|uniref:Chromosomal replication initiator protein DnaA n=1 Tax=Synechocystis sp. (strain ATCC 27184 / PCC 6803 / Kazusa) TaxID=1111708 RepID=DNAA_SYNY3|nr:MULTISPECIES: chromosomal replication initiator protein DnaA [unclassified Synechocystis]P49995.2 RecName: Full=Chromosomal replication initiator protein DnaA [Synechocystis sp. PCC 6803 substr. Kazusa]BAM51553.1 chromosome replication initiator DnaA [Synechocystis sp. PCC 6803] [Bacillus subtilis BEST7613]AGF51489.1 chromosomal replication initiator protein DnaA [Synechocystis sp. PCC 6803]ALJ67492.1 chromosomal replication initiator DnaA [Synechocystis sp. PCC 6803]AVP89337.1 chromosomal 